MQNKNAIDKVMLFSGVAMPRWDDDGNCTFDGKLGVWAFVRKVLYYHSSYLCWIHYVLH